MSEGGVATCPACDVEHPRGDESCPGRRVGTLFDGKYQIAKVLGCGGMGAVFAARHVKLERDVALKLMLGSLAAVPHIAKRFLAEARQLAALDHPSIVRIYDTGEDPSGTPYIAMEMLAGMSLEAWARGAKRPAVGEAVDAICEALAALEVVHAAGMVHRDIKPDNLFRATRGDGTTRVVLLDFGIARAAQPAGTARGVAGGDDPLRMTADGSTLGTLAYMAPEQFTDSANVDVRTDVFAIAASLFRIVTGRPPIWGTSKEDLIRALVTHEYPRSARALGVAMPVELDDAIARALDPDRARRTADAATFRRELVAARAAVTAAALDATEAPPAPAAAATGATGPGASRSVAPPERGSPATGPGASRSVAPAEPGSTAPAVAVTPAVSTPAPAPRGRGLVIALALVGIAGIAVVAVVLATRGGSDGARIAGDAAARPLDAAAHPLDAAGVANDAPVEIGPDMARIPGALIDDAIDKAAFARWCKHLGEAPAVCAELLARVESFPNGVDAFALDRHEVAHGELEAWLATRSDAATLVDAHCTAELARAHPPAADDAAACMTHAAAAAYCADHGKRLPTSAEWARAAGSFEHRVAPWLTADDATLPATKIACGDAIFGRTHADPVGACATSGPEGPGSVAAAGRDETPAHVYQLGGNVSEWVELDPVRGAGHEGEVLARGGSWAGFAIDLHPAKRLWIDPKKGPAATTTIGFRCARSLR